jgi:hypothetical protein
VARVPTQARDAATAPARPHPSPSRVLVPRRALVQCLWVLLVAGLVAGFYLAMYLVKEMPIGWDTARYLDQANLIAKHGIHGAAGLDLPRPSVLLASRVGFPVTVLTLSALFRSSTFEVAAVIPAAAAAATALAAGAFVSVGLRRSEWHFAVVAAIVGVSPALVRLMGGTYTDNLLAGAVFMTAMVPLIFVAREGRGFIASIALLTAGGLAHPAFFTVVAAVLAVIALCYVPASWRAWRGGEARLLSTPSARVGLVLGGAGALSAAGIYGLLGAAPDQPILKRGVFVQKMREDLPLYRLPLTVPIALLGAVAVVRQAFRTPGRARGEAGNGEPTGAASVPAAPDRRADARFDAWFVVAALGAWVAVSGGAILAFVAGRNVPAHRFLAFLLPLPILVALGLLAAGGFLTRRRLRWLGAAVVSIGVLAMVAMAYQTLYRTLDDRMLEWLDRPKVQEAATAAAYLDAVGVPDAQPVVMIITDTGPQPRLYVSEEAHILRTAFPAERIPHLYFYVGDPNEYLAGRPTIIPGDTRGFNVVSRNYWPDVATVRGGDPVALVLSSYQPAYGELAAAHPERVVAPNVLALHGPLPAAPLPRAPFPTAPQGVVAIAGFGIGALVVLSLIGLGWALALLPAGPRPFEIVALSVGLGIGALLLGGTVADALGVRLAGAGGALVPIGVGVVGWLAGAWRLRRRGRVVVGL